MRLALLLIVLTACETEGFSVNRFTVEVDQTDLTKPIITDTAYDQEISVDEMAKRLVSEPTVQAAKAEVPGALGQSTATESWDNGHDYDFGAFVVRYRGRDTYPHPLRPCVYEDVTHVHFSFRRHVNDDPDLSWSKIHIGTYSLSAPLRTCYVVFDSQHTEVCGKLCFPDFNRPPRGEVVRVLFPKIRFAIEASNKSISSSLAWTVAFVLTYIAVFAL